MILIIKTGHTVSSLRAQWEDFEDWIVEGSGFPREDFMVLSVFKDEPLPLPQDVAGAIITGSPSNVTEQLPWMVLTTDWLRNAIAQHLPILGICFGHQLLAHALGGEVAFHPGGREIGTVEVLLTEEGKQDALLGAVPPRFNAQVSHLQTVVSLPPQAVILASNAFDPHHAVRYAERAWGLQFHPEFSRRIMLAYIDERRPALEKEGFVYEDLNGAVQETPVATALLQRFVSQAGRDTYKLIS
ncbi:MAG: glutamine amidotransferase [Pseudohongiellaceae bacterium]